MDSWIHTDAVEWAFLHFHLDFCLQYYYLDNRRPNQEWSRTLLSLE
jgi:hypothetical protein